MELAAGDGGDDPDRLFAAERGFDPVAPADVLAVDVDVHERPQFTALVEEQVPHGKRLQRFAHGAALDLELLLPARLLGEQARQQDSYHSVTSTESTAGRCRAASIHSSPSFEETKTEPLFVPK